jgi:hypothetical protein
MHASHHLAYLQLCATELPRLPRPHQAPEIRFTATALMELSLEEQLLGYRRLNARAHDHLCSESRSAHALIQLGYHNKT